MIFNIQKFLQKINFSTETIAFALLEEGEQANMLHRKTFTFNLPVIYLLQNFSKIKKKEMAEKLEKQKAKKLLKQSGSRRNLNRENQTILRKWKRIYSKLK